MTFLKDVDKQIQDFRQYLGIQVLDQAEIAGTVDQMDQDEVKRLTFARNTVPKSVADLLDPSQRVKWGQSAQGTRKLTLQRRLGICAHDCISSGYATTLKKLRGIKWLARYRDQQHPTSSIFLRAMPADKQLTMDDHDWTCTVRRWVALPDVRHALLQDLTFTCACGKPYNELHTELCNAKGWLTKRSDKVNLTLLDFAVETDHYTFWELPIPTNQRGRPGEGRIDGVCKPCSAFGKVINFDGTIVSPAASAYVDGNSNIGGHAVRRAEYVKNNLGYAAHFERKGEEYMGVAMSTTGRHGTGLTQFMSKLESNVKKKHKHRDFELAVGTYIGIKREMQATNWNISDIKMYYTAVMSIGLQKSLTRQADACYLNNLPLFPSSRDFRNTFSQAYNDPTAPSPQPNARSTPDHHERTPTTTNNNNNNNNVSFRNSNHRQHEAATRSHRQRQHQTPNSTTVGIPNSTSAQRPSVLTADQEERQDAAEPNNAGDRRRGPYKCGKCGFLPKTQLHDCAAEIARHQLQQHHQHPQPPPPQQHQPLSPPSSPPTSTTPPRQQHQHQQQPQPPLTPTPLAASSLPSPSPTTTHAPSPTTGESAHNYGATSYGWPNKGQMRSIVELAANDIRGDCRKAEQTTPKPNNGQSEGSPSTPTAMTTEVDQTNHDRQGPELLHFRSDQTQVPTLQEDASSTFSGGLRAESSIGATAPYYAKKL